MQTPCIRLCTIDADSALCLGCGRSLAEIGGWTQYDDTERRAIMTRLPERLAQRQAVPDTAG